MDVPKALRWLNRLEFAKYPDPDPNPSLSSSSMPTPTPTPTVSAVMFKSGDNAMPSGSSIERVWRIQQNNSDSTDSASVENMRRMRDGSIDKRRSTSHVKSFDDDPGILCGFPRDDPPAPVPESVSVSAPTSEPDPDPEPTETKTETKRRSFWKRCSCWRPDYYYRS